MRYEEIPEGQRTEYKQICPCCSWERKLLTQSSNFPEYEAEVYLQCECGEWLEFILPVN